MELRQYVVVLRRHKWLILQAVVIVCAVAAGLSTLQEPRYRATARVLLHPNDPAEQLYADNAAPRLLTDPDRYVSGQIDVIESPSVRREAARLLGLEARPAALTSAVSVRQDGNSDVLEISATERSPHRAARIANAVARAYIENRRARTVQGLDRAVEEAQQKLAELETRMAELDAQLAALGTSGPASSRDPEERPITRESLLAARQAVSDQYQSLYARQQELVVNKSLKQGEAEIVSDAKAPAAPTSPNPWRNGVLGAVGGLLLGLAAAFLKEQLDERLRSREEVERANGLPVLAEIPLDVGAARDLVVTMEHPLGSVAEAVRSLRSSLLFLDVDRSAKRLVVTSPGPAEGKSFVAANLAAAYAQAGFSTILVSGDLRRPRLDSLLGSPSGEGLSDVVSELSSSRWGPEALGDRTGAATNGSAATRAAVVSGARVRSFWLHHELERVLAETPVAGLRLLPAGGPTPNPAELLGSLAAGAVFDELSDLADVVVVDTPPVLAVTDATILAAKADGVILVNALGQTRRDAAVRSKQTLENVGARLLGVVVNKVRASSDSYFYYSGYYGTDQAGNGGARSSSRRHRDGRSGRRRRRQLAKAGTG
ncbi:MAG TPA: Wzz/FepE/Etk N-terminal domain-containing protein [Acidimicrobiales bacterium]|nr:Wzz/FepE/Etk N-terminal domain-containing protein [Acidimicrobiales bacterium]